MAKDLTSGNPLKQILLFALPLFFGGVFQQVYNIVDTAIVGKFLGAIPLAGVGAASPIVNFLVSLLVGFSVGASIVIARLYGERHFGKISEVAKDIACVSFAVAVAIAATGILSIDFLLNLLKTPADALPYARTYLGIVLLGMLFTVFFNQLSGMMRGLGDSKTPLFFLAFSSILNIMLDLLLIVILKHGVAGAAWATVIAQGVSCLLTVGYIVKKVPELHFSLKGTSTSKATLALIVKYGLPMGLQQCSISLGHVLMQGIVNTTSTGAVSSTALMAAYASATKIDLFAVMPMVAIAGALSNYTAQCVGQGKHKLIKQAVRSIDVVSLAFCAVLAGVIIINKAQLVSLFLDGSESYIAAQALSAGTLYLMTSAPFYFVLAFVHNHLNVIAGLGGTLFYMVAMITMMLLRVVLAWTMVNMMGLGFVGVWISFPASWVITLVAVMIAYAKKTRACIA